MINELETELEFAKEMKRKLVMLESAIKYLEWHFCNEDDAKILDKFEACSHSVDDLLIMSDTFVERARREYVDELERGIRSNQASS